MPTAKVGHKKARTGCLTCRSRKVKCDEECPMCANCARLRLDCAYPKPKQNRERQHQSKCFTASVPAARGFREHGSSSGSPNFSAVSSGSVELMKNDGRMRLRLLHAWMSRGLESPSLRTNSEWRRIWMIEVPQLALQHDNVLFALLALSATQLRGKIPNDRQLAVAGMEYWNKALVEQHKMISQIPKASIEASTFSGFLISINAFAMLRDRSIEPYTPPVEWLYVSRGAWDLCPFQNDIEQNSTLRRVVDITASVWKVTASHEGEVAQTYESLLQYQTPLDDLSDLMIYRTTLVQLTVFRQAVLAQEPPYQHARRICIFAQLLPPKFVSFLQEQRPRALVILARLFALVAHTGTLHLFGDYKSAIPEREVRAIARVVPPEWQGPMVEALDETLAA